MARSKQSPAPGGVYAALATPRQPNSVDADAGAFLDYVDVVVQTGVHGLVLFGSTGEFVHFSLEERMRALALAIRRSRVPVLVNVSHSSLEGATVLAEHATASGAAGLLLMPPYFYRYTDHHLLSFFHAFADFAACDETPLYLYNLPSSTTSISPAIAQQLLSSSGYKGIIDSSGDWDTFSSLVELRQHCDFTLLAGDERIFLPALRSGADAAVASTAAAVPELPLAIYSALRAGNDARAEHLNSNLEILLNWVERLPPLVALKRAAALRGWPVPGMLFPVDQQTCADLDLFTEWFRAWWRTVLSECTEKAMGKL